MLNSKTGQGKVVDGASLKIAIVRFRNFRPNERSLRSQRIRPIRVHHNVVPSRRCELRLVARILARPNRETRQDPADGSSPGDDSSSPDMNSRPREQSDASDTSDSGSPADGSSRDSAEGADNPRGDDSGEANREPSGNASDRGDSRPSGSNEDAQSEDASKSPTGGEGDARRDASANDGAVNEDSEADQANMEYAKQATDLALEYLKDHGQDQELLEKLGWSPDEMNAFVKRWQQMRQNARQAGAEGQAARRDLADQLRGLGLRPSTERLRQNRVPTDRLRNLRQSGSDTAIPTEYLEQYRAFLKSIPAAE